MSAEFFLLYKCGADIVPEIVCCNPGTRDDGLLRFLYERIGCESIEVVRYRRVPELLGIVDEEGALKLNQINIIGMLLYDFPLMGNMVIGQQVTRDGEPDIGGFDTVIEAQKAAAHIHMLTHERAAHIKQLMEEGNENAED